MKQSSLAQTKNINNNTNKKPPKFSAISFEDEFKKTIRNNSNFFCNSKSSSPVLEDESFKECSKCLKDYCKICYSLCHPNNNCPGKFVDNEIENYFVSEFAASCHCEHNLENKSKSEYHLICFYMKFLSTHYGFKHNNFHILKDGSYICDYCVSCENTSDLHDFQSIPLSNSNNISCQCKDQKHMKLHLLDFLKIFHTAYDENKNKINFIEIKSHLQKDLNSHFNDILEEDKRMDLINYHSNVFIIDNIMFNINFEISFGQEMEFFQSNLALLQNKNNLFFNREKINMTLTYIFYFYRKYFFTNFEMISTININVFNTKKRLDIMCNNRNNLSELRESTKPNFEFQGIKFLFDNLLKLKTFTIKLSNSEPKIPFTIYFMKLLFESYFLKNEEIDKFLNILFSIEYKKNYTEYNTYIRRLIDEILFISQICRIDNLIFNSCTRQEQYAENKLTELLFFSDAENKKKNLFSEYLNKMFSEENNYFLKSSQEHDDQKSLVKWLKNLKNENLFYFDCFHNDFIRRYFNDYNSIEYIVSGVYPEEPETKSKFILLHNMKIEWIRDDSAQESKLRKYLDEILDGIGLLSILNSVRNQSEFNDYLFHVFNKSHKKNSNITNFDVSKFLNNEKIIDLSKIDLKPYMNQLKFIFYKVFILDFYLDKRFNDLLNKWNLLLFSCVCNLDNVLFIFSKIRFLDFLFYSELNKNEKTKKTYLTRSLFNSCENLKEEKNFTWRFFYISYCHYINKEDELIPLRQSVLKDFVNYIMNFYSIIYTTAVYGKTDKKFSKRNLYKTMNHPLIYYFLKITKKLFVVNSLHSCFPYNYNLNKFESIEKINTIANIIFEKELNFKNYFSLMGMFDIFGRDSNRNNKDAQASQKQNEIQAKTSTNFNIEMQGWSNQDNIDYKKKKSDLNEMIFTFPKRIDLEFNQLLIIELLGGFYATTDLNIYFKILNDNLSYFEEFFTDKKNYALNNDLKPEIFRCEVTLLKFLLNFIRTKFFDHSKIEIVTQTNINKNELIAFGTEGEKGKMIFENTIDIINNPVGSRYMITKMKIEVLKTLTNYLKNFDEDFYKEDDNKCLGLLLADNLHIILKEFDVDPQQTFVIKELRQEFSELLKSYFEVYKKMLSIIKTETAETKKIQENDYQANKDDYLLSYQEKIETLLNKIPIRDKDLNLLKKISVQFLGFGSNITKYFEIFVEFENKKFSNYNTLIQYLITDKTDKKKKTIEEGRKKSSIIATMNLIDESQKLNETTENHKQEYDYSKTEANKDAKDFAKDYCSRIWNNLNKGFADYNKENLNHLLNYLLKDSLKVIEKYNDAVNNINFDSIFSENFLKTINFLNNLMHHNVNFQENLVNQFSEKSVKILLKNVIKMNNYIIGISEYESNINLMSLSKIYFILMDFFILLCEGLNNSQFEDYFFLDLNEDLKMESNETNRNSTNKNKGENIIINQKQAETINNPKTNNHEEQFWLMKQDKVIDYNRNSKILNNMMKFSQKENKYSLNNGYNSDKKFQGTQDNFETFHLNKNYDNQINDYNDVCRIDNKDFKKGAIHAEEIFRDFNNKNKIEIGLDNIVLDHDELNDSTDFHSYSYTIKNEIEKIMNEKISYFDLKNRFVGLFHKFYNLIELKKEPIFNHKKIKPQQFKEILEENGILFKVSKMIFELLLNKFQSKINADPNNFYSNQNNSQNGNNVEVFKQALACLKKISQFSSEENLQLLIKKDKTVFVNQLNQHVQSYLRKKKELLEFLKDKFSINNLNLNKIESLISDAEQSLRFMIEILKNLEIDYNGYIMSNISSSGKRVDESKDSISSISDDQNSSISEKENKEEINIPDRNFIVGSSNKQNIKLVNEYNGFAHEAKEEDVIIKIGFDKQFSNMLDVHDLNSESLLVCAGKLAADTPKIPSSPNKTPDVQFGLGSAPVGVSIEKKGKNQLQVKTNEANKDNNKENIEEEEEINKGNFYYFSFLQLRNIINLINRTKLEDYSDGSYRLILQFLYITRFLREFLEIGANPDLTKMKKNIIDHCFKEIFDPKWILSENIKNDDFSYIFRSELLNLLVYYLEENSDSVDLMNLKFKENEIDEHKIFNEIKKCFETFVEDFYEEDAIKDHEFTKLTFDYLFEKYIHNDKKILDNKFYTLAETYYKLIRIMENFHESLKAEYNLDANTNRGCFDFFLKKNEVKSKSNENEINIDDQYRLNKVYYQFLSTIGIEIEVKYSQFNGDLAFKKIFFFKTPKCFWVSRVKRLKFLEKAPKQDLEAKLDYFNKNLDKLLLVITASYHFRNKGSKYLTYLNRESNFRYLDVINFFCVFVLNILLLIFFYEDPEENTTQNDLMSQIYFYKNDSKLQQRINYIFFTTIAFCFVQIGILVIWIIFRYKLRRTLAFYKNTRNEDYFIKEGDGFKDEQLQIYSDMKKNFEEFKDDQFNLPITDWRSFLHSVILKMRIFIWNKDVFYIVFSLILNTLYLITNYKLLLVIPILSIVNLYPLFRFFYRAMLSKYQEFIALLIFIYSVEYIFSWISFLHFQEFMISEHLDRTGNLNENDNQKELICSTAIECFLNYVDLGLRLGGGMGDSSARLSFKYQDKSKYFLKIFWDILFHIIVNLILGNIFFGVIVDTFNDLRDKKDEKTEDELNLCFMCNRERFENNEVDFDYHRMQEHYIFNYYFFIPYLLRKTPQEYSRAEVYAWEQINLRKNEWLPSPVK